MLDKDLDKEGVFGGLNKGWDSVLDYVPPNVRLYAASARYQRCFIKRKDNI